MARSDSVQQQILEQSGRKFFIKKIALTATTAVITAIGSTDVYGNTIPAGATLVIQPVGTDIMYELREAGAVTAITATSGARPGTYVVQYQQEPCTLLGKPALGNTLKPGQDTQVDIYPLASGTALLFWMA